MLFLFLTLVIILCGDDFMNISFSEIKKFPDNNKIYLLEKISDCAGFFCSDRKPLFMTFDAASEKSNSLKTNLLEMETHVFIKSVANNNSFPSGFCNVLKFSGDFDSPEFFSFVELCKLYSKEMNELEFSDFFHALAELFQTPQSQSYKNALGLFGELKFLEHIKNQFGADLSKFWHVSDSFSKYDISLPEFNIEIKSALDENIVMIKHSQIFNEHRNFLVSVVCENYDAGENLKELSDKLLQTFQNLEFAIKVKKELLRIKQDNLEKSKFEVKEIHLYDAAKINPFLKISDDVTELKYKLNLSEETELDDFAKKQLFTFTSSSPRSPA